MTNTFIEENNEKKAIKLAYKKLLSEINKKLVDSRRALRTNSIALLLGVNQYNIIYDTLISGATSEDPVDLGAVDIFAREEGSCFKIWSLPIYVAPYQDDLVDIIMASGDVLAHHEDGLRSMNESLPSDHFHNYYKDRLSKYIEDLPESSKFKRVEGE